MYSSLFLLLLQIISISYAIRCYQCGSESIFMEYEDSVPLPKDRGDDLEQTLLTLESCSNLEFSFSSWGLYAVDCAPDQICTKTIMDSGFDENGRHRYVTSSRGCAMRSTAQGKDHWMGCGILKSNVVPPAEIFQDNVDLVCFCDEDYCNGAEKTRTLPLILFLPSIILSLGVFNLIM